MNLEIWGPPHTPSLLMPINFISNKEERESLSAPENIQRETYENIINGTKL